MRKRTIQKFYIAFIILFLFSYGFTMEDIPQSAMEIIYVDSEETAGEDGRAVNVLDGDPETFWHTEWSQSEPEYPHEIIFKLDKQYAIENFSYWPRQNSGNGRIKDFQIYVTNDTSNWGEPVVEGEWPNQTAKQIEGFDAAISAQYVKLIALSEVNENPWATAAEINLNDAFNPNVDIDGWASSLHLGFRDDSDFDAQVLMVDIEVDSSSPNTYYAPINFTGGYCGIQDQGNNRTLHFSLWDYVDGDVSAVPEGAEAKVLWKGYRVNSSGFGGEGTGVKTWKNYQWKNNQPYRLLVKMRSVEIDSFPGATRDYWVYDPEFTEWMHIATLWRADDPTTNTAETDLGEVHVFVEDWAATAAWHRSCYVYNARKKYRAGSWYTYTKAYYSINDQENNPATGDGHDPNTQAEVRENKKIWLATGGDFVPENRTLSGTLLYITPDGDFDPKNPGLTDIYYTMVNDTTIEITWDYKLSEWAAQECFDIRIYSDANFNNLVYKTGDLYPHDYESVQWEKNSDRKHVITGLDFSGENKYYLRLITKTIFGVNCWNSKAVEISEATGLKEDDENAPCSCNLEQNYPNPFNPSTNLLYSLTKRSPVDLAVYDLKGKKIKQLYYGLQNPGAYTAIWNGQNQHGLNCISGIYLAVLKSGSNLTIRKMVLVK
ncbi:MAG: DUF3472 domain-containing protein [Candidatus Marinimicrobia bacterium]|nr:DUF3472 domain-containing protein [Candidatus Neomarinimicrobiota bacterium]